VDDNKVSHIAAFSTAKFAVPEIRKAGGGSILSIASITRSTTTYSYPAYSALKMGVVMMTSSFASLLASDNIRVNCICPSFIELIAPEFLLSFGNEWEADVKTYVESIPLERIGKPEEVALAAFFLVSDEASCITGINLPFERRISSPS